MIARIKDKKKKAKAARKKRAEKEAEQDKRLKADSEKNKKSKNSSRNAYSSMSDSQRQKSANPYLKKEISSGKVQKARKPDSPPSNSKPEKKKSSKADKKSAPSCVVVSSGKSVTREVNKLQNGSRTPDGMKRAPWGQLYDPRFGMPPPPNRYQRRQSDVFDDFDSEDEYDSGIFSIVSLGRT